VDLKRAYTVFGQAQYERWQTSRWGTCTICATARLSEATHRLHRHASHAVNIGERRKPVPHGKPGFIRIDTVHQGDLDGVKGVYHINAVDEVTQWQVMAQPLISARPGCFRAEGHSGAVPVSGAGFHSDNGSEFINHTVAGLLNKLLIEQTKSRRGAPTITD